MTLHIGVTMPELLPPYFRLELEQIVAALQVQFNDNIPGLVRDNTGHFVPLTLSLRTPELLDPVERDELERIIASLQSAFNTPHQVGFLDGPVQGGVISVPSNVAVTAAIHAVDPARTIVTFSTSGGDTVLIYPAFANVMLTNATTVTAARNLGGSGTTDTMTVRYWVRQFVPGVIKSIQRISVTLGAGIATNTTTILGVDTTKTVLIGSGQDNAGGAADGAFGQADLTNATTVTVTRNSAAGAIVIYYLQVVEYF